MKIWFVFLFSLFIWGACSQEHYEDAPIKEEAMVSVLVDMHKVDAMLMRGINSGFLKKDQNYSIYKTTFEKHGITPQLFDSAINYYSLDFKHFDEIYSKVINRLRREEEELKNNQKPASVG